MTSYNPTNERMKRQYFAYLTEAQGHSEQTIDAVAKAIARFEAYTRCKDFKTFHIEQAKAFKRHLAEQGGQRSGEPLSKATLYATLTALKRFFVWLAGQPGYKSRIQYSDGDYFNLSTKETRIAKATRPARVPTLEQIRHVIFKMPVQTEIERRDRALIAFTILTGARDGATASFKLRHIDIERRPDRSGRARGEDEILEVIRHHLLPGGRRHSGYGGGVGNLSSNRKTLGAGRPAVSGDKGGRGRQSPVRGGGPRPQALEQRGSDPERSSRRHSLRRVSLTSTRTASGRRLLCLAGKNAIRPNSTRRGRKISVMRTY